MSIIVSHVCRRWREYALNIPTMWASLHFSATGLNYGWYKEQVFLKRSKDATLDIEIVCGRRNKRQLNAAAVSRILRLLLPHTHRWKSLIARVHIKGMKIIGDRLRHASAPALEVLNLAVWSEHAKQTKWRCRIFSEGIPNLRKWRTNTQLLPPPSVIREMDKLRELVVHDDPWNDLGLRYPKPEDVARILSGCSNLEKLHFRIHNERMFSLRHHVFDPIELPKLVSLHFNSPNALVDTPAPFSIQFCRYIHAPLIRSIQSSGLSNSLIPIMASFSPFPGLQELNLRAFFASDSRGENPLDLYEPAMLRNALSSLSLLTTLVFEYQVLPVHVFEILHRICPHLIHFTLNSCTFTISDCIEMVKARMTSQSVTSLQVLRISQYPERDLSWFRRNVPQFSTL